MLRLLGLFGNRAFFLSVKVRIELLQDLLAGLLDVHVEILQNPCGDAVAFAEQAEENVLGADIGVIERLGFLGGKGEHLLDARRVGDVADHLLIGAGANLFLDLHADGLEIEAHLLENVHRDTLSQLDEAKEQVLGTDKVVIEPVGFLARESEDLLRSRREIVHGFIAHSCLINASAEFFVQRPVANAHLRRDNPSSRPLFSRFATTVIVWREQGIS